MPGEPPNTAAKPEVLATPFELSRILDGHALTFIATDGQEVVVRLATDEELVALARQAQERWKRTTDE